MALLIDALRIKVRASAVFNPEVQEAPACILWTDRDRQWEAVIPRLLCELPELYILGDYAPEKRTGPAIWLRCALAGQLVEAVNQNLENEHSPLLNTENGHRIPILYLPGVSRQDLRAVENCPDHLKPLAELQYRGVIWSQINSKDWTILAFLKSDQGGLGLDVGQDKDSRNAMQLALFRLLDEQVEFLQGKHLDAEFFKKLIIGDPVRNLLQWMDHPDAFRTAFIENEWLAYVQVCKTQFAFDPQKEGALTGAAKLAARKGPWKAVWARYCEAPKHYPNIPTQIRKCKTPLFDLFTDADSAGGWPQWNEQQETALQHDLLSLCDIPPHKARKKLTSLEKQHGCRRLLVWAELGQAPLAQAMEPLSLLAETTNSNLCRYNKRP